MEVGVAIKIIFNRRNIKLEKGDKAPLVVEVYFKGGKRKIINTDILLEQEQWGTTGTFKNKVKSNHPNYIQINQFLASKINEIETLIYSTTNNGGQFTPLILDNYLDNKMVAHSFYDFYEAELEADKEKLVQGTKKEHRYTLSILKKFHPDLRFSDLTFEFVQSFDRFLRKQGLAQNTIHKHHKHILRFLNIAIKRNYFEAKNSPYLLFNSPKVKGDRENLTKEELKTINGLELPFELGTLDYCRDIFLFSCYTGLRFGDLMSLTGEHIDFNEEKGTVIIRTTMEKVEHARNIKVVLPLNQLFESEPLKIFKRYFSPKEPINKKIFKQLTNQEVNRQLKIIAGLSKIRMALSFHIARHTFGTLLADITGNPYLIMQLMGHSDIKTSMIYIHQSEDRLYKSLEKYENLSWL